MPVIKSMKRGEKGDTGYNFNSIWRPAQTGIKFRSSSERQPEQFECRPKFCNPEIILQKNQVTIGAILHVLCNPDISSKWQQN